MATYCKPTKTPTMKRILGLGNALTDELVMLPSDEMLDNLGLPKGSMQIISSERYLSIKKEIRGLKKKIVPGGSASNTCRGISRAGGDATFMGMIGNDDIGALFEEEVRQSGTTPLLLHSDTPSGTALTFISPDSERTFATCLGAALEMTPRHLTKKTFKGYDILHIEGYQLQNHKLVSKAVQLAKENGMMVSMDLASYNIVLENLDFLRDIIPNFVDIIFANEEEAKAFTGKAPAEALDEIAEMCHVAIVKVGRQGSFVKSDGATWQIGISEHKTVDSTGAGDFYAAGFLYGIAAGHDVCTAANIGKLLSGNIVSVVGVRLPDKQWAKIRNDIAKGNF